MEDILKYVMGEMYSTSLHLYILCLVLEHFAGIEQGSETYSLWAEEIGSGPQKHVAGQVEDKEMGSKQWREGTFPALYHVFLCHVLLIPSSVQKVACKEQATILKGCQLLVQNILIHLLLI